jgi:TRAP-type C4-dicarboxylate transport system permease small subunit
MQRIMSLINKIIAKFLIILMASIVLDVTWQVFTRFILRDPSSFTEELAGFLLIWIGILGASHAVYTRAHLGIDVLTYRLTGKKKQVVEIVVYLLVLLFAFFIMIMGGLQLVRLTLMLNQISAAMGIKMGYVYLVIPVSGILIVFYSVGFILEAIKKKPVYSVEHKISAID